MTEQGSDAHLVSNSATDQGPSQQLDQQGQVAALVAPGWNCMQVATSTCRHAAGTQKRSTRHSELLGCGSPMRERFGG